MAVTLEVGSAWKGKWKAGDRVAGPDPDRGRVEGERGVVSARRLRRHIHDHLRGRLRRHRRPGRGRATSRPRQVRQREAREVVGAKRAGLRASWIERRGRRWAEVRLEGIGGWTERLKSVDVRHPWLGREKQAGEAGVGAEMDEVQYAEIRRLADLGEFTEKVDAPALAAVGDITDRSIRPDEWSGPWPSKPCGSSRTTDERWPHFCSDDEMNSSTMVWAPLAKSPNWASQSTSASGRSTEYPYSKPIAAYSDSSES